MCTMASQPVAVRPIEQYSTSRNYCSIEHINCCWVCVSGAVVWVSSIWPFVHLGLLFFFSPSPSTICRRRSGVCIQINFAFNRWFLRRGQHTSEQVLDLFSLAFENRSLSRVHPCCSMTSRNDHSRSLRHCRSTISYCAMNFSFFDEFLLESSLNKRMTHLFIDVHSRYRPHSNEALSHPSQINSRHFSSFCVYQQRLGPSSECDERMIIGKSPDNFMTECTFGSFMSCFSVD